MIENYYFRLKENFHQIFLIPKYIKFTKIKIKITPDHLLPYFKKKYPLYNEFLPIMSKFLKKNSILIDVGANCGDTLFSIFEKNKNLFFYCFEADKEFFQYLEFNKKKIGKKHSVNKIKLYNQMIGCEIKKGNLTGGHGTKKISKKLDKNLPVITSKTLDSFFLNKMEKISLLKSDIDGFDYDILASSIKIIKKHSPIIFFECDIQNNHAYKKYIKIIHKLKKFKYNNFVLFNNYGKLVLTTNKASIVKKNIKKQLLSKKNNFFFDILMYTQKDKNIVFKSIEEFNLYERSI